AGKGTQAGALKDHLRVPHVSTGDMFRAHLSGDTELGKVVKDILASGQLVPDTITNQMVAERLAEADTAEGALLDGFPRNVIQAAWLDGYLAGHRTKLSGVVVLRVPDEELRSRLVGRAEKENRSDDADPAVVQRRIDTYKEQSEPCIAYYKAQGMVDVHEVDGVGSIEEVEARIRASVGG
ncbi:MAG: adenylate kinase, partial [Planctomycetota bacterium]|nr:adenylate kinase [Planctomycetota bacterium]